MTVKLDTVRAAVIDGPGAAPRLSSVVLQPDQRLTARHTAERQT